MRRRISAQSWESVPPAPAEEARLFELGQPRLDRRQLPLQFGLDLLVFLGQLGEVTEFGDVGLEAAKHLQAPLGASVGGGGAGRGLLVVPEAGGAHRLL